MSSIQNKWKMIRELGLRQLSCFLTYQVALKLGIYKQLLKPRGPGRKLLESKAYDLHPVLNLPDPNHVKNVIGDHGLNQLRKDAGEIVSGRVRLFGSDPVSLDLYLPGRLEFWTAYHDGVLPGKNTDIKFTWEPARLGWTFTLCRAYALTRDEVYSKTFWDNLETFWENNPPYLGPNWSSGQEVALRILALVFAAQIFAPSTHTTNERLNRLVVSIAQHASRIPPTLNYARAQNNNHLISEAVGLVTASLALPNHPKSPRWGKLGWKHFNYGLLDQIDADGAYTQQSTNYHRLVLQLALWVQALQHPRDQINALCADSLKAATTWLSALVDPETGGVPNLGPNDGAYILPLTVLPFSDYRPVIQAASRAFWNQPSFEQGSWDELGLWLGLTLDKGEHLLSCQSPNADSPIILVNPDGQSWTYLRAAKFLGRPGHADQLHADLWWRGMNLAQDAGTFLYNADDPWNNALPHTSVHNTVMIDDREQMTRAGRFLYLDRASAQILSREFSSDGLIQRVTAYHDGYRSLGIRHQRTVSTSRDGQWVITDELLPIKSSVDPELHRFRLHWLLPDWRYEIMSHNPGIRLRTAHGWISLMVTGSKGDEQYTPDLTIVRGGKIIHGTGPTSPVWGWVSPTYGVKNPALSLGFILAARAPLKFMSVWEFPVG